MVQVRRALVSVYDKTGLIELAQGLHRSVSSCGRLGRHGRRHGRGGHSGLGGRRRHRAPRDALRAGRRRSHPRIHGGILADRANPEHVADMDREGYGYVDLVVVNLYPFLAQPAVETIDIGGPTMIRAAAKNHAHVAMVTDPSAYPGVLAELQFNRGTLGLKTRRQLALEAFAHTAAFDAAIVRWFQTAGRRRPRTRPRRCCPATCRSRSSGPSICATARTRTNGPPATARWAARPASTTRPSSTAARSCRSSTTSTSSRPTARWAFGDDPACVIVKHANPCGVAVGGRHLQRLPDGLSSATRCPPSAASWPSTAR